MSKNINDTLRVETTQQAHTMDHDIKKNVYCALYVIILLLEISFTLLHTSFGLDELISLTDHIMKL